MFRRVLFALLASLPGAAHAGGYELLEQSALSVGQAFSGAATGYGDGSEVFFNPAALSLLETNVASAALQIYLPRTRFKNDRSSYAPELGGAPLAGGDGGNGGEGAVVPNAYAAVKLTRSITAGFGINSPFGLATKFDENWVGRYSAIESSVETVNINPGFGAKMSDDLSIGASLQIIYAKAKLENAVDFGALAGLAPGSLDGRAAVDGNDWGVGAGAGLLYVPSDRVRLGLSYRSKIDLTLEGGADFTVPQGLEAVRAGGLFTDTGARADLTLPPVVTAGGAFDFSKQTTVFADATWLGWSTFDTLVVEFDGAQPDSLEREEWNDSWRIAGGIRHALTDRWTIRAGAAWDESPISDDTLRTPRIPDSDRYWVAGGVSYRMTPRTSIGVHYAHLFVRDARTSDSPSETGSFLNGSWASSTDIIAFELSAAW